MRLLFFIIVCIVSYVVLFTLVVYAQTHAVKCPTGVQGPVGGLGPQGKTGLAGPEATGYLHKNSLTTKLTVSKTNQSLPSSGLPWKSLRSEGDSATFSWSFNLHNPTSILANQSTVNFILKAGANVRPFRTIFPKQVIALQWQRPSNLTMHSITVIITRNSTDSVIVTAVQGVRWVVSGEPLLNDGQSNVYCSDINFKGEDIFLETEVQIRSTEELVPLGSSVQAIIK
jgi:hypothetical protein